MATKRKKSVLGFDARDLALEGINFYADAVGSTLGPYGAYHMLEKGDKLSDDGRNIGWEVEHPDEVANRALGHLRQISTQVEQETKNGSTSVVVLARAILNEALQYLPSPAVPVGKLTPAEVAFKIMRECEEVTAKLEEKKLEIKSVGQLVDAVAVATKETGDRELATIIANTQWELGPNGILLAEEHIGKTCVAEKLNGILLDNGLARTDFINNQQNQSFETTDARIILTNNTIDVIKASKRKGDGEEGIMLPMTGLLTQLGDKGFRKIIIMARAFSQQALQVCELWNKQGFQVIPVNAPYVDQAEIMRDLQAVHGGRFVHHDDGSPATITEGDVGFASKVQIERYRSVFVGPNDDETKGRIEDRVSELRKKLEGNVSDFERDNLERRISQLTTGFALIKIGAITQTERKRLKDKADDAVGTSRMVMRGGAVRGGGITFMEIAETLPKESILKKPLQVIYNKIKATAPADFVFEEWVIDSLETLKIVLKYACQFAATFASMQGAHVTLRDKPRLVQEVEDDDDVA